MEMSVGAGFAQSLFEFAVSSGADADQLAALSGYTPRHPIDLEQRVNFSTFKAIMQIGMRLSGDLALPLRFGSESQFQDMSIVGLIAYAAPTMGEAFAQMNRFAGLAVEVEGHKFQNRFSIRQHDGDMWLHDDRLNPNDFPELTESTFARFIGNTRRHFGDAPFAKHIHVTHKKPSYSDCYDKYLRVPVTFESTFNAIAFHESWLSIRTSAPNSYTFGIFSARAEALLKDLQTVTSTKARVEALLIPMLHTGEASIENIAIRMGVSRTSLYRRLGEEETSFAQVYEDLRHRLAKHYLEANKVSVSECAYLVGFSDPASFSRAFKRWTGLTPKAYQQGEIGAANS